MTETGRRYLARKKFHFSWRSCAGWFGLSLFMGYPVAQTFLELKQARSRALIYAYGQRKRK